MKRLAVAIGVVLLFIASSDAATYYLDPASGAIGNDGSEGSPWPTLDQVYDANKFTTTVQGGDTLLLLDGMHYLDGIHFQNVTFDPPVVIMAAPGQDSVKVAGFSFTSCGGFIFDGFKISPAFCGGCRSATNAGAGIILVRGDVVGLEIRNSEIFTVTFKEAETWSDSLWQYGRGNGVKVKGGGNKSITVAHCDIWMVNQPFSFSGEDFHVDSNTVNCYGPSDLMQFGGIGPFYVNGNHSANVLRFPDDGAHSDMIQIFADNAGSEGVYIKHNIFLQRDANHPKPEFSGPTMGLANSFPDCQPLHIENNIIANDHHHGIVVAAGIPDTRIINNTVIAIGGSVDGLSPIKTSGTDNVVANNMAFSFGLGTDVTASHNITLVRDDLPNYFVDPDNFDYRLKEGSPAIDAGDNTYIPTGPDAFGSARMVNGTIDVGACEYSPSGVARPDFAAATEGAVLLTNPVIGSAWFRVPGTAVTRQVTLTITDARGLVRYRRTSLTSGTLIWGGTDNDGNNVGRGIYLYSIQNDGQFVEGRFFKVK